MYDPIYSLSNLSCSKVHLNIDVRMYDSFRPAFLSMKSINFSQCLPAVYEAWSYLGARTISLQFNTQRIKTMNIVFGNYGRLFLAMLLGCSPKSVASGLLLCLHFVLESRISLAHFFETIPPHCLQIDSALSKLSKCSQFSNVFKKSAMAVSLCRGQSRTCFKWFCPRIMD